MPEESESCFLGVYILESPSAFVSICSLIMMR